MTLEERLAAAGVTTLEALEAKIAADAKAALVAEKEAIIAAKEKQIKDLEAIKGNQGTEIGTLRTAVNALQTSLEQFKESKKTENVPPQNPNPPKGEDDWKRENSEREQAFTDEEWTKADEALKALPAEAKALVKTEEGRAAFYARVLGSTTTEAQETLRRPQQKAKLTVAEQLDLYLSKTKVVDSQRVPTLRPAGLGTSSVTQKKPTQVEGVVNASISDRLAALKTG